MKLGKEVVVHDDLEGVVILQESPQQVVFIPSAPFVSPVFGVFKGIEDVVDMNIDTLLRRGKTSK